MTRPGSTRAWLRLAALSLLLTLADGCAGRAPAEQQGARSGGGETATAAEADDSGYEEAEAASMPASVDSERAPAALGSTRSRDRFTSVPRPEPSPWDAHEWAIAPAMPQRVMLATVTLPPGDTFRPPATACQDVLLLVREGELQATGTGVATSDAPATLYRGDAVRFGPEGDGLVVNAGTTRARTVMAVARRAGTGAARGTRPGSDADACAAAAGHFDPLRRPLRVGSVSTTPPISIGGGRMEVRILLDTDGAGAEHGALSWLEGTPDAVVAEHRHEGAAEILLVEDGEGVMTLGDEEIAVRPGAAIYVPEGTLHSFRGAGTRPLRAIQIYAPAGPEQRFRGM